MCGSCGCDPCNIVGYPRPVNPISGLGTPTEVAFFETPSTLGSDPNFFWDDVSKGLQLGPVGSFPTPRLSVLSPTAQILFLMQKTTAPSDFFIVATSTGNPAALSPIFFAHSDSVSPIDTALYFLGTVSPANDNPGDEAVIWFAARRGDSSGGSGASVVNRPLFKWINFTTELMRMEPSGFVGINFSAPTERLVVGGNAIITGKLTVGGSIDPTDISLSGSSKRYGALDAGPVFLSPFANAVAGVQIRRDDNLTVLLNADTLNERVQIGASASSGTEKLRVVAAATANGLRVEATGSGVGSPLVINSTGTYTSTGQYLGYFANPTLAQTGGAFHGSTVRSLATLVLSATATVGQYYTFHDNNTLSFAAPAAMGAYASFRANATKTGTGAVAAYVGFLAQPGGAGAGTALYYGVFVDAYATPTVGVGGHFQGLTAALEVGAGAVGAAAVTGRWFDSGKMVLGAAALDATETLKVAGGILTTVDRGYTATAQTSSAGAAAGTLLNSPAAGNPTFWLKVNINGVALAVPCWPG